MLGMYLDIGQEKEKEQTEKMLKMPWCFRLLREGLVDPEGKDRQLDRCRGSTGAEPMASNSCALGDFSNGR